MPPVSQARKAFTYRPHPHLYEINVWAWLEELSAKRGQSLTLGGVPDEEWDALKALGFDFVWLMGVWERSPLSRRFFQTDLASFAEYDKALPGWKLNQIVGSPYSVRNYRPDPRVGTWKDVDRAHAKLNARGMGLLLDFVANHTALDHPWVAAHPEYYVQGAEADFRRDPSAFYLAELPGGRLACIARGKDPYFPPWQDVAQLNYFQPAAREALLDVLRTVAQHCDGVRCDMAMLVLNDIFGKTWAPLLTGTPAPEDEFWTSALAAVPGFVWLAEVYWDVEWRLQQLGLQFTYDKRLYDRLRAATPRDVWLHLKADLPYQNRLARFLENHDEGRSPVVFGRDRIGALATLVATLPGMRFYHQGQLEGRKIHLPVPLSLAADEVPDPPLRDFYEKILRLSNEEVFHTGEWQLLEPRPAVDAHSFENLVAYQWRSPQSWKIVVVNLSGALAQSCLSPAGVVDPSRQYSVCDKLGDACYTRSGAELAREGLCVRLEGNRAGVFDLRPA